MHKSILTQEQATSLCREWQERMGLLHWSVIVRVLRERDMHKKNARASVTSNVHTREAFIELLDPLDYEEGPRTPAMDMEESLVHELVHLWWEPLLGDEVRPMETMLMEQAVNDTARTIIALHRK